MRTTRKRKEMKNRAEARRKKIAAGLTTVIALNTIATSGVASAMEGINVRTTESVINSVYGEVNVPQINLDQTVTANVYGDSVTENVYGEWATVNNQEDLDRLWQYSTEPSEDGTEVIVLTNYIGASENTKVEIPRDVEGKRVELANVKNALSGGVTHVKVADGDDSNKVKLRNGDMSGYNSGLYMNTTVEYVDLSGLEAKATTFYQMARGANNLKHLNLSGWDVSEVSDFSWLAFSCPNLEYVNFSGWDINGGYGGMFTSAPKIKHAVFNDMSIETYKKIKSTLSLATAETLEVKNIAIENDNTSLEALFQSAKVSEIIGLETWDTSKVTNMKNMFNDATNLVSLEGIKDWDVRNVGSLERTFRNCSSLTELDLSNWEADSLTSTNTTFSGCSLLTTLDLTGFNMTNVAQVPWMFQDCSSLEEIKGTETWTLSNAARTKNMFSGCTNLKLYLPRFAVIK